MKSPPNSLRARFICLLCSIEEYVGLPLTQNSEQIWFPFLFSPYNIPLNFIQIYWVWTAQPGLPSSCESKNSALELLLNVSFFQQHLTHSFLLITVTHPYNVPKHSICFSQSVSHSGCPMVFNSSEVHQPQCLHLLSKCFSSLEIKIFEQNGATEKLHFFCTEMYLFCFSGCSW